MMVLLSIDGYSQISVNFNTSVFMLYEFKLNNSETKYFGADLALINASNQFLLYNLDGSLYKTIQMPQKPATSAYISGVYCITESLFDNDPSNIEYLVCYNWDSTSSCQYNLVKVIREDGTILLNELNATYFYGNLVYNTEEGTKLRLSYIFANGIFYKTQVFNLPGEIPTTVNDNNEQVNYDPVAYPNPNNGSFFVRLHSREGDLNSIDLYSGNGMLVESFTSRNNPIHLNKTGLSDGLYFLNYHSRKLNSTTKVIIAK